MKRREFVAFLGGAVLAWPLGALAQQRDHPRRIGVLMGFAETDEVWQIYLRVFRERLRDFGWTDGQNIKFEYRFAGESVERTRDAAAELVGAGFAFRHDESSTIGAVARNPHHSDRVYLGVRVGGKRLRQQPCPSWRQCYRLS